MIVCIEGDTMVLVFLFSLILDVIIVLIQNHIDSSPVEDPESRGGHDF